MTTWSARVKTRMKELKMTQDTLARKMGITRGAVTHYLAGRRVPPLSQFQKMAAILKADPAWLQFGTYTEKNTSHHTQTATELTLHPIPIISWEQVAEFVNPKKSHMEVTEYIPNFYTDKSHWYALRVKGDAMTAQMSNKKSFHEGDVIIIDPNKTAAHGNYVVAILRGSKEATFKQYVVDGGVRYLKPLNPQYPITEIDDSAHICGAVVNCLT